MDYRELLAKPFEFVAEKLSPVDVAAIFCDADVSVTEVRKPNYVGIINYDFRRATLVSNKPLKGYRQDSGVFLKEPSRHDLRRHADALGHWIRRGPTYRQFSENHHEGYKFMERELLGLGEDYAFVPSNASMKEANPDYPFRFIPEDSILVHEITHAWLDKGKRNLREIHRDRDIANEAVCMLLELSHLSAVHPDKLERRVGRLKTLRRTRTPPIYLYTHTHASDLALEIWESGKAEEVFARLRQQ
ncbi:MAG: hypothetical protein HYW25_04995 [Candidatus Aenigmarchaeota archaeon]|nr:hypothetical protein [Candidatus Aenigmarchaeota archaeon]